MGGGVLAPNTTPANVPASMVTERATGPAEVEDRRLGFRVSKPEGPEWVMTDKPEHFLIPETGKVVEMHRNGGRGDPRFATIYVYVLPVSGNTDGAAEVREMERLDKKAAPAEFTVEEERPALVSGRQMVRRITLWNAPGRVTKFLSVRCVERGRLYVVFAFTDPGTFKDFLPDFETVINSLRIG